jgi:hypothetical protein
MATHDIARETWAAFFDDFSKEHRNLLVTVTTVSPGADGPQAVQSGQTFAGIALDQASGEAGAVVLTMGRRWRRRDCTASSGPRACTTRPAPTC